MHKSEFDEKLLSEIKSLNTSKEVKEVIKGILEMEMNDPGRYKPEGYEVIIERAIGVLGKK